MEKDVMISITGQQLYTDEDPEAVEFITNGTFCKKDKERFTVSYMESELTGTVGMTTTLEIQPGLVTVMRTGPFISQLIFEQGKRHVSLYETGEGPLTVSVNTQEVATTLTEKGGNLDIRYMVEVNNALVGENTFHMKVWESRPKKRRGIAN